MKILLIYAITASLLMAIIAPTVASYANRLGALYTTIAHRIP
jgi:hypothetical protein